MVCKMWWNKVPFFFPPFSLHRSHLARSLQILICKFFWIYMPFQVDPVQGPSTVYGHWTHVFGQHILRRTLPWSWCNSWIGWKDCRWKIPKLLEDFMACHLWMNLLICEVYMINQVLLCQFHIRKPMINWEWRAGRISPPRIFCRP